MCARDRSCRPAPLTDAELELPEGFNKRHALNIPCTAALERSAEGDIMHPYGTLGHQDGSVDD